MPVTLSTLDRRRRVLVLIVLVALVSAGAGWVAGRMIQSPDEAARNAAAPPAAPITVPVERRVLESAVVVRGDVRFATALDIEVAGDLGDGQAGELVVTGRVPSSGDEFHEGDIAIEVSGRPVFLLTGELPMYRALRPGAAGADVRQLEQALSRLGHFPGVPDNAYDEDTGAAVRGLYEAAGYTPTGPSTEERAQLTAARSAVDAAAAAVSQAESALTEARQPPPLSALLAAEGAVEQAQIVYDQAVAAYEQAVSDGADDDTLLELRLQVVSAESQLAVAQAQLAELTAPPDAGAQTRALADARARLRSAELALGEVQAVTGIRVPRGEVVFVTSLPRRVDQVDVAVGATPGGRVMSLTGADLRVETAVLPDEAGLLSAGQRARLDDQVVGVDLTGTVSSVADAPGTGGAPAGRFAVVITPDGGDPEELSGLNLRVTIPIRATAGAVLAVPLAALVTDSNEVTRVRVARGDTFEDVAVRVGLAAGGFAEVTPVDGTLEPGDLVVVGTHRT